MKILLKVLIGIGMVLAIALAFVWLFGDKIVENYLQKQVSKASNGVYALQVKEVDLDLFQGSLLLQEATIQTDTAAAKQQKKLPLLEAGVAVLAVRGFNVWDFIFNNTLEADSLLLREGQVHWQSTGASGQQQSKDFRDWWYSLDIYPKIKGKYERISLGVLQLAQVDVYQQNAAEQSASAASLQLIGLALQAHQISIRESTFFTPERFLYTKQISLQLDTLKLQQGGPIGSLLLQDLNLQLQSNLLSSSLSSLQGELSTARGGNLSVTLDSLQLSKLNTFTTLEEKALKLQYLLLQQPLLAGSISGSGSSDSTLQSLAQFSLKPLLQPFLDSFSADSVVVEQARVALASFTTANLFLKAADVRIDSLSAFARDRFLHATTLKVLADSSHFALQAAKGGWQKADFIYADGKGRFSTTDFTYRKEGLHLLLPSASFTGMQIKPGSNMLQLQLLQLQEPRLTARLTPAASGSTGSLPASFQPYLKPFFDNFLLETFQLNGGALVLNGQKGGQILEGNEINLEAQTIAIDERSPFSQSRFWHARDASLRIGYLQYLPKGNKYLLKTNFLAVSASNRNVLIRDFLLKPIQGNPKFWYDVPYENAYYVAAKRVSVAGIQWQQVFLNKYLQVRTVEGNTIDLRAFKDKEKDPGNRKPLPQEMLRVPTYDYFIGDLDLEKVRITYRELSGAADTAGVVYVTDVKLTGKRITDRKAVLRQHPIIEIKGSGQLMGAAQLEALFAFDMLSPSMDMILQGEVGAMDAETFNKIAQFNSPILIKSGDLLGANWQLKADSINAQGEMQLFYQNLKIQLNTGDRQDTSGLFQDLASGLVNTLVVDDERLPKEETKPAQIKTKRQPSKSFFNYYWRSLLEGIKECIGVPGA